MRLSQLTGSKNNNFNLLRFGAAFVVFAGHCFSVHDYGYSGLVSLSGFIAVNVFFIISGFLVTKSLIDRHNPAHFVVSRVLRIYPALIVAVLYTVVTVSFFAEGSLVDWINKPMTIDYLRQNILQYNIYTPIYLPLQDWGKVNTPLWTLSFELHMYFLLFVLGFAYLTARQEWLKRVIAVLSVAMVVAVTFLYYMDYAYQLDAYVLGYKRYYLRFISSFGIGAIFYIVRHRIILKPRYIGLIIVSLAILSPFRGALILFAYTSLAYFVIYAAYFPSVLLGQFNKMGDYSYGIYIYGYPTQKAVSVCFEDISILVLFLVSFTITLLIAFLSWHFVEAPALKIKKKLVKVVS